ncbi:uncharacterized protein LOC143281034 [Babylonia areolata]|uniref:uncharacterized protein LOC143281034 n=1 Tax=Babylonia areolata TaxID=304850 RepID=UPI003FD0F79A
MMDTKKIAVLFYLLSVWQVYAHMQRYECSGNRNFTVEEDVPFALTCTTSARRPPTRIGLCSVRDKIRCMDKHMHRSHIAVFTIKQNHLSNIAGTVECEESVWNGWEYALKSTRTCKIIVRYPADKVRSCWVKFNADMTVSGSCEVDRISSDDPKYSCDWYHESLKELTTTLERREGGFNCIFSSNNTLHKKRGRWGLFRLRVDRGDGWMVAMSIIPQNFATTIEGAEDGILTAQENKPFTITCTTTWSSQAIKSWSVNLSCPGTETKELESPTQVWNSRRKKKRKRISFTPKYTAHNGIACKCSVTAWTASIVSFRRETSVTVMVKRERKSTTALPKPPKTTPPSVTPLTTSKGTWRSTTSSPTDNSKGTTTTTNTDHDDDDNDDDSLPIAVIAGGGGGGLIIIIVVIVVIDIVVKRRRDSQESRTSNTDEREDADAYAMVDAVDQRRPPEQEDLPGPDRDDEYRALNFHADQRSEAASHPDPNYHHIGAVTSGINTSAADVDDEYHDLNHHRDPLGEAANDPTYHHIGAVTSGINTSAADVDDEYHDLNHHRDPLGEAANDPTYHHIGAVTSGINTSAADVDDEYHDLNFHRGPIGEAANDPTYHHIGAVTSGINTSAADVDDEYHDLNHHRDPLGEAANDPTYHHIGAVTSGINTSAADVDDEYHDLNFHRGPIGEAANDPTYHHIGAVTSGINTSAADTDDEYHDLNFHRGPAIESPDPDYHHIDAVTSGVRN